MRIQDTQLTFRAHHWDASECDVYKSGSRGPRQR